MTTKQIESTGEKLNADQRNERARRSIISQLWQIELKLLALNLLIPSNHCAKAIAALQKQQADSFQPVSKERFYVPCT